MPLYEYECPGCGRSFEKLVRASQADAIECPNCGGKHAKRKLSVFAFKGGQTRSSGAVQSLPVSGSL